MFRKLRSPTLVAFGLCIALCVSASGCAQDRSSPQAGAADATKSVEAPGELPPSAPNEASREAKSAPTPLEERAISPLAPLDASCAVDSDCEVKDVGNCCGRMPACVNRAAIPFDAAAMQRECERTGTSSICGFQELSGCRCESGRCVGVPAMSDGGDVR